MNTKPTYAPMLAVFCSGCYYRYVITTRYVTMFRRNHNEELIALRAEQTLEQSLLLRASSCFVVPLVP